jgi:hypothetical protein
MFADLPRTIGTWTILWTANRPFVRWNAEAAPVRMRFGIDCPK